MHHCAGRPPGDSSLCLRVVCPSNRALDNLELVKAVHEKDRFALNAQTENRKWTALHLACWRGSPKVVEFLLEQGAVPDLYCSDGLDALGKVIKSW